VVDHRGGAGEHGAEDGVGGGDGRPGLSIDQVTLTYADIDVPEATIEEPTTPDGDRILHLRLPEPETGGQLETGVPIVATSWRHGEPYPDLDGTSLPVRDVLAEAGIAIAFGEPVTRESLTGIRDEGTVTPLAELDVLDIHSQRWLTLPLRATPIEVEKFDESDETLLTGWTESGSELVTGVQFNGDLHGIDENTETVFRLVLYADFVIGESGVAVGGTNIGGLLPTDKSTPGGTFRSWFTDSKG
jgi:hypothetical protein